ncbi:hypothetical protein V865_007192 [Kwoniella europaea PYCC6329]|uniref:BTB domain-containing protein n=1 Tax=Kwoniella europaea PYCC6329 TaxID=1423913 RepID=A0AAX4KS43_9TREE
MIGTGPPVKKSTPESISSPKSDEKNVHPFHRYGDIQLISKDNMILMADSRRLSDVSWHMGYEVGKALSNGMQIEMDGWSSETISLFLDLINVSKPSEPTAELPVLFELATFCQDNELDNEEINELLRESMVKAARIDNRQWSLLLFTNEVIRAPLEWQLAKSALRIMTKETFLHPIIFDTKKKEFVRLGFWRAFDELPKRWQRQLIRSTFLVPDEQADGTMMNDVRMTTDWEKVADQFDPAE